VKPCAQRQSTECRLTLVAPPDRLTIAQEGAWCLVVIQ
jgi:hypothetical protein